MSGDNNNGSTTKCGLFEIVVFIMAVLFGTACSICSKTMMSLHGTVNVMTAVSTGNSTSGSEVDFMVVEKFDKPIFQTFGMFVGMTFGLVMHWMVLFFKIPFPGYNHVHTSSNGNNNGVMKVHQHPSTIEEGGSNNVKNERDRLLPKAATNSTTDGVSGTNVPIWMYFFLAIPSVFDLGATALCMMGLRYLDVSIYQLLRGSGIIFVALMKQHVLGDALYKFQWFGVFLNVVSVFLVGSTAILNTLHDDDIHSNPKEAFLGVVLVMCGAFVQALQFVFEEKVMAMDEDSAPPLLLIGMEGLWGTILCLFVVYPIVYYLPGNDHGSFENPFTTYEMIQNSSTIQLSFFIYFFTIFGYNLFAVLVTYTLNSIWHAILDNFRPITVWCTDMLIYYVISSAGDFGEPWTPYSYIQLVGMVVLLYGTAVYNAPNAGSILCTGKWYTFFIDFQTEYEQIEKEELDRLMEEEWALRQTQFKAKRLSSMAEQRSPHYSIHSQALGGLGATRM